MIEQIKELREKGMSFRKIAAEIGSTVGKVQYRWNKYMSELEIESAEVEVAATVVEEKPQSTTTVPYVKPTVPTTLVCQFINSTSIVVVWEDLHLEKTVLTGLYDVLAEDLQLVIRVHNITAIEFNGTNSHYYQDMLLPSNREEKNWLIKGLKGGNSYTCQVGYLTPMRKFFPVMQSLPIHVSRVELDQPNFVTSKIVTEAAKGHTPKWIEHVSTYTYYEKSDRGESNDK